MQVTMKVNRHGGSVGLLAAGSTYDLADDLARQLVAGGWATFVSAPTQPNFKPDSGGAPAGVAPSITSAALTADRALSDSDMAVNLVLTANRAVVVGAGLNGGSGFSAQFTNQSGSAVTITATPAGGTTVNGGTSAVTRTLQPWQTTALIPGPSANTYTFTGA